MKKAPRQLVLRVPRHERGWVGRWSMPQIEKKKNETYSSLRAPTTYLRLRTPVHTTLFVNTFIPYKLDIVMQLT